MTLSQSVATGSLVGMSNTALEQLLKTLHQSQPASPPVVQSPIMQGPPIQAFQNPFSPGGSGQAMSGSVNDRRMESSARQNARQNAPSASVSSVSSGKATAGKKVKHSSKGKAVVGSSDITPDICDTQFILCLHPVSVGHT